MDLAEIRNAVYRYGFDSEDPVDTWVNAAYFEILDTQDFDWAFLESVATVGLDEGDPSGTLPADCAKLKVVRDITDEAVSSGRGYPLEVVTYERWDMIHNQRATGIPQFATLIGTDTIEVYPVPNKPRTLKLLYHKSVDELGDSSDVPVVPKEYHYTIVRLAAATGLMAENEEERAQTALMMYQNDIERMGAKYSSRHFVNFDQVVVED